MIMLHFASQLQILFYFDTHPTNDSIEKYLLSTLTSHSIKFGKRFDHEFGYCNSIHSLQQ